MHFTADIAPVISFCLGALIALVLYSMWKDLWVDEVRNSVFAVRDDLFSYACVHGLLDHPAHVKLRALMNSMLRYAHDISFAKALSLALTAALWKMPHPDGIAALTKAIDTLPANHRSKFQEFHNQMILYVGMKVIKDSLVLRALVFMLGLYFRLTQGDNSRNKQIVQLIPVEALERDALAARA
jgi:hypothetical protein